MERPIQTVARIAANFRARGDTGARDAGVHVFYDLSATATKLLARQLAAGTVNPITAAEMGTVSRVTFVKNVDVKGNAWVFGGLDAKDGAFVPISIPRVVTNGGFPFSASIRPRPLSPRPPPRP